jgi:hypothetical protein
VPLPSDQLLSEAERWLRVDEPGSVTNSHLADGRRLGWHGPVPPGHALTIDAEITAAPVPPMLARRFGTDRFWERWTRAEALCKLADVPMLAWMSTIGLDSPDPPGVRCRTLAMNDLTATVALASIEDAYLPGGDQRDPDDQDR